MSGNLTLLPGNLREIPIVNTSIHSCWNVAPATTSCEALLMTHYFDALGFTEKKLEAEAMNPTETKNHQIFHPSSL